MGNTVSAYVEPVLLRSGAPECSVADNYNMARYEGRRCGPMVFMGQGAGRFPTASAVLRDLSCVLEGQREMLPSDCAAVSADNSRESHSYYVRMSAQDAASLPLREILVNGPVVRALTEAVSVRKMHALAQKIRK